MKAFAGEFDRDFTLARLTEVRSLLDMAETLGGGVTVAPMSVVDAYDGWAATYDGPGNAIFAIEEGVVLPILDALPPGVALDAACGTGRHAAHLAAAGHIVHGVDSSPRMLAAAREKVPAGHFVEGELSDLPMPDASVDLVVNALALAHVQDLGPFFREAARVLRPGGSLVISDTRGHFIGSTRYPLIKWDVDGNAGYLPTWRHATSEYLAAALPVGFLVRQCLEQLRPGPISAPNPDLDPDPGPAPPAPAPAPPGDPPDIWQLHSWAADAADATYRDDPCLIVWHFQRPLDAG